MSNIIITGADPEILAGGPGAKPSVVRGNGRRRPGCLRADPQKLKIFDDLSLK